jgi:hypothetical protein
VNIFDKHTIADALIEAEIGNHMSASLTVFREGTALIC